MLNMREGTCFHSNMTVKTYFNCFSLLATIFSIIFFFQAHPLYTKIFSARIWTNLKNDPGNVKKRGIPRNSYMSVICHQGPWDPTGAPTLAPQLSRVDTLLHLKCVSPRGLSVPTVIKCKPGCLKCKPGWSFWKCRYYVCSVFFPNSKYMSIKPILPGDPITGVYIQ